MKKKNNKQIFRFKGMTLAELLAALMITAIVLAAVATLSFAMGNANDNAQDVGESQARIRYATLKIAEQIKYCRLICGYYNNELILWSADSDNDGKIDYKELLFINFGNNDAIKFITYSNIPNTNYDNLNPSDFTNGTAQAGLNQNGQKTTVILIPQCSNLQVRFDQPGLPAWQRKFVSILFNVTENGQSRQYQIDAKLRAYAGNLVNSSGTRITDDD